MKEWAQLHYIYFVYCLFDFRPVRNIFIHGFVDYLGGWKPFVTEVVALTVGWLFLYHLFRQKIFLKI